MLVSFYIIYKDMHADVVINHDIKF